MRKNLLLYLKCPNCQGSSWSMEACQEPQRDRIMSGNVVCQVCKEIYVIRDGVINIAKIHGGQERADETDGWKTFASKEGWLDQQDAYLDTIPFGLAKTMAPGDTLTWDRHARNFFRVLSHLDLRNSKVLDLGSGRCWSTKYMALQGADCVSLDLVEEPGVGLRTANYFMAKLPIIFDLVRSDMNRLPFKSQCFDIVLASGAAHHSLDIHETFREAFRVLKPGGKFVLANEHCNSIRGEEDCSRDDMPEINEHCYRGYRIAFSLRRAGFRKFQVVPDAYYLKKDDYSYRRFSRFFRVHPKLMALELFLFGGVFNLIVNKPATT